MSSVPAGFARLSVVGGSLVVAFSCARSQPSSVVLDGSKEPSPIASFQDAGWGASQAIGPEPAPSATPPLTCEELVSRAHELFARREDEVGSEELQSLRDEIRKMLVVATAPRECVVSLLAVVSARSECGKTTEFLATDLFAHEACTSLDAERVLTRAPAACQGALLGAVRSTSHPTLSLARLVERLARRASDPNVEAVGWLTFGSLATTAREKAETDVPRYVQTTLAVELRRGHLSRSPWLLGAAGNAGCGSCVTYFAAAERDSDLAVRMRAYAAWRFVESAEAVEHLCRGLGSDAPSIRATSAWALRYGSTAVEDRIECLIRAAAHDSEGSVRTEAVMSLSTLVAVSSRASSALLHLTDDEYPRDVRQLAMQQLSFRSDVSLGSGESRR
jgi:hypothetical protein